MIDYFKAILSWWASIVLISCPTALVAYWAQRFALHDLGLKPLGVGAVFALVHLLVGLIVVIRLALTIVALHKLYNVWRMHSVRLP